ncbi:hypothetical protein BCR44DRAFT_50686 [Catenaria anguillulae PL171]|uniref:Ankyrin repeat-containing domain protein n=1 Tax=Catenaria anguillulae PL171 TaxID=765915 RepID=A0A1Y2HVF7_9FUNG|nr:hypothetical protein BCR44DRAFT_50686 [Catenaria anguillulae PL171]
MTADSAALAVPELPLSLVELVLALVPVVAPGKTPIVSILNVLPMHLVPAAVESLIIECFAPESALIDVMAAALERLFRNQKRNEHSKALLRILKRALQENVCDIAEEMMALIAEAGNLPLLKHLTDPQWHGIDIDSAVVARACIKGHVDILEWCVASGYSLQVLDQYNIFHAARAGHLSVLMWWSKLEPFIPFDFADSELALELARNGRESILRWWKERFGLDHILFAPRVWVAASANGHVGVLDFAKANGFAFPESLRDCIDSAASNGHVHVLDWWYNATKPRTVQCDFDYSVKAMDGASANGHIQVLDFFAKSGLDLQFTPMAMQAAREAGHIQVVQWWNECRLYRSLVTGTLALGPQSRPPGDFIMLCAFGCVDLLTDEVLTAQGNDLCMQGCEAACRFGHVAVLNALKPHIRHISLAGLARCIGAVIQNNQPEALRWCIKFFPTPTPDVVRRIAPEVVDACNRGHVEVLEVLDCAGLLPGTTQLIIAACDGGSLASLDFLSAIAPISSWDADVSKYAWRYAAENGHVSVLQWLADNGVRTGVNPRWIDSASTNGHYLVLEWWKQSKLPFKFTEMALWNAVKNKHEKVIRWWIQSRKVKGKYMLEMLKNALDQLSS